MPGEPTLRRGDQSVDGWVEYLQEQLVNHNNWIQGLPDETWVPTGDFDERTEHYVRVFQRGAGVQVDGIVGNETWNVLHGRSDDVDPSTDGREPHTYVEQAPRLEWENDYTIVDETTRRYSAINVGSAPISDVVITVEAFGPVGALDSSVTGHTYDGEPVPPGGALYFDIRLERPLQEGDLGDLRLTLPAENGGAMFNPGLIA